MYNVTKNITIPESEIELDFVRASGPGGQNVNKVASAVQLRFDVRHSSSLPDEVRERLIRIAGNRMTSAGVLIIDARRHRTQQANREDAIQRLIELVRRAARRPKRRKRTRPPASAREQRLRDKRKRSMRKRDRRGVDTDDD